MLTEQKQPVIQSVFDRRLEEQNETFFLKALQELQGYKRELSQVGVQSDAHAQHIGADGEKMQAYRALLGHLNSSENVLLGVLNSFDVLSEESLF